MNITFLLGNGFDIQCGLNTSYIDFYKYILKKKYSINIDEDNLVIDEKLIPKINNIIYQEIYKHKDDIETWADLELQLGKFTIQLKEENQVGRLGVDFMKDFETLREDLNEYLKIIQINENIEISEDFSEALSNTMDYFFKGVSSKEFDEIDNMLINNNTGHFNYFFMSFNYTNSVNIILKNCMETSKINIFNGTGYLQQFNSKIVNVHGTIDNLLTLGVNDETQLAQNLFQKDDKDELIKPTSLENNGEYMRRDTESGIEYSDLIVIFGMSIGSTDKHWWEKIANVLLNSKSKKLIIHLYEENPSKLSPWKVRKRREDKKNEFISQLDNLELSEEQITQLKSQMYIVTKSEYILNVKLSEYSNQGSEKSDKENQKLD